MQENKLVERVGAKSLTLNNVLSNDNLRASQKLKFVYVGITSCNADLSINKTYWCHTQDKSAKEEMYVTRTQLDSKE